MLAAWTAASQLLRGLAPWFTRAARLAALYMASERPGHVLQARPLVNDGTFGWWTGRRALANRDQFAMAAQILRRVLADADGPRPRKTRHGQLPVSLSEAARADDDGRFDLVALDRRAELEVRTRSKPRHRARLLAAWPGGAVRAHVRWAPCGATEASRGLTGADRTANELESNRSRALFHAALDAEESDDVQQGACGGEEELLTVESLMRAHRKRANSSHSATNVRRGGSRARNPGPSRHAGAYECSPLSAAGKGRLPCARPRLAARGGEVLRPDSPHPEGSSLEQEAGGAARGPHTQPPNIVTIYGLAN